MAAARGPGAAAGAGRRARGEAAEPECERRAACCSQICTFPRGRPHSSRQPILFWKSFFLRPPFPLLPPPPAPSPLLPRGLLAHSLPPAGLPIDGGYDYIWGPEQPAEAAAGRGLPFSKRVRQGEGTGASPGPGARVLPSALCAPSSRGSRSGPRVPSRAVLSHRRPEERAGQVEDARRFLGRQTQRLAKHQDLGSPQPPRWRPGPCAPGARPAYRVSARAGSHVLETQLEQKKDKLEGDLGMSAGAGQNVCKSVLRGSLSPRGKTVVYLRRDIGLGSVCACVWYFPKGWGVFVGVWVGACEFNGKGY